MKVILRTDITNVGRQGEVKEVAPGYARNYLLPRQLAMEATTANMKQWEREKEKLSKQRDAQIAAAKDLAAKIEAAALTITVKAGEGGKLFGSVNNAAIAKLLAASGFEIDKHDVLLPEPLKETGVFEINIRLHPEVMAKARVGIVEEKSAHAQEEAAEEQKEEAPKEETTEEK